MAITFFLRIPRSNFGAASKDQVEDLKLHIVSYASKAA